MWSTNESISLFYGSGTGGGECFTSTNTSPAERVQFIGNISVITGLTENSDDIRFWGIYPYNQSNSCDGSSVTTVINSNQLGKANTWEDNQFVSIGRSFGLSMGFYNVCSALRFYFERDDIKAISFRGRNSEDIAGVVKVVFNSSNEPVIQEFVDGEKEITLYAPNNGSFTASTSSNPVYYYLVVPPMTFAQGFVCTLYTESQYGSRTMTSSFTFERSKYHNGGAIDHNVTFTPLPLEPNQIRYTATERVDYNIPTGSNTGNQVVSNNWDSSTQVGLITFSNAITELDKEAFCDQNALVSVMLPNGLTRIGERAFEACENLSSVDIPSSVNSIGGSAFAACTSLEHVSVPELIIIGAPNPFAGCTNLLSFSGPDVSADGKFLGFHLNDPARALLASCALGAFKNRQLILPEVAVIGPEAFFGGEFTGTLAIPNTVNYIGFSAFEGCNNLRTIVLERGNYDGSDASGFVLPQLPTLEEHAFPSGTNPCTIKVPGAYVTANNAGVYDETSPWYGYRSQVVVYQADNEIWYSRENPGAGLDPGSVFSTLQTSGGTALLMLVKGSFSSSEYSPNDGLTAEPVVPIPEYFSKQVVVEVYPDDVAYVANPTSLLTHETYVSLPHSIEGIGAEAFMNADLLAFPSDGYNLHMIGDSAFKGCTDMSGIVELFRTEYVNGSIPQCSIGNYAFQNCSALESVTLHSCFEIGAYAFDACVNLGCVNVDGPIESIGPYAFYGCGNLVRMAEQSIQGNILAGVFSYIQSYAFSNTGLTSVNCYSQYIDDHAFSGSNLSTVTIQGTAEAPTTIDKQVFSSCDQLTSVTIPYVAGTLGENAFYGCSSLQSINLGATAIPANYFKDFTSLKTVVLPNATSLGESAFEGCTLLESISIPQVTTLGANCFKGKHKLSSLSLPAVTTIGAGALGNGIQLSQVTIGPNITSLTNSLFTLYEERQTKPASFNLTMQKGTPPDISDNTFKLLVVTGNPTATSSPITVTLATQAIANTYANTWKAYDPFKTMINQIPVNQNAIFLYAH